MSKCLVLCVALLLACPVSADVAVIPYDTDPQIIVDGRLNDWADVPNALVLKNAEQVALGSDAWSGADDLSAVVHLAWHPSGLALAFEVVDDVVHQPFSMDDAWNGDHVNLYLDFSPQTEPQRNAMKEGQFQIALTPGPVRMDQTAPRELSPQIIFYHPAGVVADDRCHVAGRRTENGYVIEALIPFELLNGKAPDQGDDANFAVAISDTDHEPAHQETWMTCGTQPWTSGRLSFSPVVFGDGNGKGQLPARSVTIIKALTVKPGRQHVVSFEPGELPAGKEAYLSFKARVHTEKVAGFITNGLSASLNDKPISGATLSNRPAESMIADGRQYTFVSPDGRMALWYSPDFEAVDQDLNYRILNGVRACRYEFRVTELLRAGDNELCFSSSVPEVLEDQGDPTTFIGDVELSFRSAPAEVALKPAPTGEIPVYEPRTTFDRVYSRLSFKDREMLFDVGEDAYSLSSRFSTPDGKWNAGSNAYFKHKREVIEHPEWIEIQDQFENLTDENLPLIQEHALTPEVMKNVWLQGVWLPRNEGQRSGAENPSAFAATDRSGAGMIALGDALRVHLVTEAGEGAIRLADRSFVLTPKGKYTASFAVVPVDRADFWDFINAGRRILDVNFTLNWCFATVYGTAPAYEWSDQRLVQYIQRKSANLVVQSVDAFRYKGLYAYGRAFAHIPHDHYRDFSARLHRLFPSGDVKSAVYYHSFLDAYDVDDPALNDARVLDPNGEHMIYAATNPGKLYIPTLENEFGRQTIRNVTTILDEIGADGVYWDEFPRSRAEYSYNPAMWDNCSADIDPQTFKIARLKTSVALASLPWRAELVKKIMARSPLFVNAMPNTQTMLQYKFAAFTETGSIINCRKTLLYTPIALGDHLTEVSYQDTYRGMLRSLDHGCLYAWYSGHIEPEYPTLTQHMFPFTPIELHEGFVIGQERILTNRSGYFGWNDTSDFEAHVYDRDGRETTQISVPQVERNGRAYAELRLPEGYAAAIVRGEHRP